MSAFCAKCGSEMEVRYRPDGFDTFWGTRKYVKNERCPHARRFGWMRGHTDRTDRYGERAQWFGFTDATIPTDWPATSEEQR
jgi:hypothetical protein